MESPGILLRRHGLSPKKAWGQNFLSDPGVQRRIADLVAPAPGETVVELGAGLGHLTSQLVGRGARVVAVERDRELAPVLRLELAAHEELTVVEADAATFDFEAAAAEAGGPVVVCGNLPYHLSSPILFHVLDHRRAVSRVAFLLQSEVAHRIAAAPGTEDYGLLSVLLGLVADTQVAMRVPPGAFVPPPAVESALLLAHMRAQPRAQVRDEARFRRVVKAAFGRRRKTLSNALSDLGPREAIVAAMRGAGVDPARRGETLSVEEFAALERAFADAGL